MKNDDKGDVSDMVEVGEDVENVKDIVVEDDVVGEYVEVVDDVVHLGVDDVVDKSDLEDVELYDVDVEQDHCVFPCCSVNGARSDQFF